MCMAAQVATVCHVDLLRQTVVLSSCAGLLFRLLALSQYHNIIPLMGSTDSATFRHFQTLEEDASADYGVDGALWPLKEKCITSKTGGYEYRVCPYKDAHQEEGHSKVGTSISSAASLFFLPNARYCCRSNGALYVVYRTEATKASHENRFT